MCGRFYLDLPREELMGHLLVDRLPPVVPRYNIAPTQPILALRLAAKGREAVLLRWGLIPSWSGKDMRRYNLINARAESIDSKPAFRDAFSRRRCLIPASGFFEWSGSGKGRRPYLIEHHDRTPLMFAGLWEHYQGENGEIIESCTIVVTEANTLIGSIHQRMPVILPAQHQNLWLGAGTPSGHDLLSLFRPYPSKLLTLRKVSRRVNSPSNDDPECILNLLGNG